MFGKSNRLMEEAMYINSIQKLRIHLKVFKARLLKGGVDKLNIYPMFCKYYADNSDAYDLPMITVLNEAVTILLEED